MPVCAFCQRDRKATSEHVIPAFIYSFQKELSKSVIGWNEGAQRMVGGEGKVKDVCAECNNGMLCQLDSYGKELLCKAGLLVPNYTSPTLTLEYDYSQLLRWLLKVSFNSSRMDGVHTPIFEEHIPFIRGLAPPPPRDRVAVVLHLARPELLGTSKVDPKKFLSLSQGSNLLNPFLVRICYGAVRGEHQYTLRMNIFGPAIFHLLLFQEDLSPDQVDGAICRFIKAVPGAVELTPERKLAEVEVGEMSWLDLFEHQAKREHFTRTAISNSDSDRQY